MVGATDVPTRALFCGLHDYRTFPDQDGIGQLRAPVGVWDAFEYLAMTACALPAPTQG
jgi:hypothetical protein